MEAPTPSDEMERLIELSELDLDYSNLEQNLEDLTQLAARIVGTDVSLVNLIDSYTQWSVANYGIDIDQMPREETVCQYTILEDDSLEIKDLSKDERFKPKDYVQQEPKLRYYYGVPLKTSSGANIGALCVLDTDPKDVAPEDKELLTMIAKQVVRRLEALKKIRELEKKVQSLNEKQRKVSHDIRNPISGIIGLANLVEDEIENERVNEVRDLVRMIKKGGNSLLELVEDIMDEEEAEELDKTPGKHEFSCESFVDKLNELYQPQAKSKGVNLTIGVKDSADEIFFSKSRLLQIVGNLITNSIKFTDKGGAVDVEITVERTKEDDNQLKVTVEDTGVGMDDEKVQEIMDGKVTSETGTKGEKGYGFGLSLVSHLVDKAEGRMQIESEIDKGTKFSIVLPV